MTREIRYFKRYGPSAIILHWLFITMMFMTLFSGVLLFKDILYSQLNIVGGLDLIPTFWFTKDMHLYAGFGVLIIGFIHLMIHIPRADNQMVSRDMKKDFKALVHTHFYMMYMAPREESGAAGKYRGNQRMAFLVTTYVLGLTAITVLMMYTGIFGREAVFLHLVTGFMVLIVVISRIWYILRKRDSVAIRSILMTGSMPDWYVKKYHFLWYKELTGDRFVGNWEPEEIASEESLNMNPDDNQSEVMS